MASMVKEKRRGKKKTKEKHSAHLPEGELVEASSLIGAVQNEEDSAETAGFENVLVLPAEQGNIPKVTRNVLIRNKEQRNKREEAQIMNKSTIQDPAGNKAAVPLTKTACTVDLNAGTDKSVCSVDLTAGTDTSKKTYTQDSYKSLNNRLQRIAIPQQSLNADKAAMRELENLDAYLQSKQDQLQESYNCSEFAMLECAPSAPIFYEQNLPLAPCEELIQNEIQTKTKLECMSLDEAIWLYCGTEMATVNYMSEREENEVEAGPKCAPDHPLVDLLSTFRSSIRAVERERSRLASNFDDEEKFRSTLWQVEKQKIHITEQCKCGVSVDMKATYDHAQLMKEKLPAAKLKLEGLLKDVQESYCHHQHAVLLAHCQIEDIISETIQTGVKNGIRDALSLILQSLRVSDGVPDALPAALQRWAEILTSALVDERNLRQLFFVMHHLFRQTRSVRWAARVLKTRVNDSVSAARTIAVLDTLLSKLRLESAVECVEETGEDWEEVDVRGGGGAVSSGTLRERDLIALMRALPLQQLAAKLVLFEQADFRQATEYDWGDTSGGNRLLKCCCGVRVLLSVFQRGVTLHAAYERLHGVLRDVACSTLTALACLYRTPRAPYLKELQEKITAELHVIFAAGFTLFGTRDLHRLPTTLLTNHAARDYCLSFIVGLHDTSSKTIESLSVEAPVLPCEVRVRIITHAAVDREQDQELARIVLDFLLQTGLRRKSVPCKFGCEPTARELVPVFLTAHPHLRGLALHTVAELSQVETLEPSTVSVLQVNKWRPTVQEMQALLDNWSQRCPALLQQLLLQLDYTPHTGVDHPVQLSIGSWLCTWSAGSPARVEGAWRVLLRLRTHGACWGGSARAAPPPLTAVADPFALAHAVLATEWGHEIPLICSDGVNAIFTLCATRPREAVHCLAPVMLLMPQSPESISFTPKFAELFTILLSCGPNLVQRALGRGGASGSELLLRLVLSQVDMKQPYVFTAWLHALWKVPAALSILDIAALAVRDWYVMDVYAASLIQEENAKEHITNAVRFAFTSPLLCECLLRAAHTHEVNSQLFPSLVAALSQQRDASQRIHVDNALQKINPNISSEELIIYRCANAALVAPFQHPSHLTLWRLFLHMYLQRYHGQSSSCPCGPLFFSGIIKSRTLSQIKKRLLETATYHHSEADSYKNANKSNQQSMRLINRVPRSASIVIDNTLLPSLTITDLTGEPRSDSNDSDSEEESVPQDVPVDGSTEEAIEVEKNRSSNMAAYHVGAEKMMREYFRWLEDGEKVQRSPQDADIALFLLPEALEEAWKHTLSHCRPPPSPELDTFLRPEPPPPFNGDVSKSPLQVAIASILNVKCRSAIRSLKRIRPRVDEMHESVFDDVSRLLARVNELLKDIERYAQEWELEVSRISSMDNKMWELVSVWHVARPLPPVKRQCTNKCKPITFHLNTQEWCISPGADRGIRETRSSSLAGIRRLTRARPLVARTAATLHAIARKTRSAENAVQVLELAWRSAGQCRPCNAAHSAIVALFDQLAERWVTHNGTLCHQLLCKGCEHSTSTLHHTLCGSLVAPQRMNLNDWPDIYMILLTAKLPAHTVFSFLSRFEMSRWAKVATVVQRQTVLKALLQAAQSTESATDEPATDDPASIAVLLELIGMHSVTLTTVRELSWLMLEASAVSTLGVLPPPFWKHLNRAAELHASKLAVEELGGLMCRLGTMWRGVSQELCERHAGYAPATAELLCTLLREHIAAANKLSFEPARIGDCSWVALQASWSPWVVPSTILPHPVTSSHYSTMVKKFTSCISQGMRDCVGSENRVLMHVYRWVIASRFDMSRMPVLPRAQLSVLLQQLARLPWHDHQWMDGPTANIAFRAICSPDAEEDFLRWCYERITATETETFLRGVEADTAVVGKHLFNMMQLFTGNVHVNDPELLHQGAMLPWWHMCEEDLNEGLDIFFDARFNASVPYHDLPHIELVLHAAEFDACPQYSPEAQRKRARLVTKWTFTYNSAELLQYSPSYTQFMLDHITFMQPYFEMASETQDLLFRIAFIMMWKTTDTSIAVQAVWVHWICELAPPYMIPPCVEMSSKLTALNITGPIAEHATRMHLLKCDGGWEEVRHLWRGVVLQSWLYVEHCAPHAAYACAIACQPLVYARLQLIALLALSEGNDIHFIEWETIIAVWICYATRVVLECNVAIEVSIATAASTSATDAEPATEPKLSVHELEECKHAALSLLATWGQQQRRSILKVVTLQADTDRPTARHRALIRLADCIISPSAETAQAYESACAALSGSNIGDVSTWARITSPKTLPRLAVRLFPTVPGRYFQYEMDNFSGE